MELDGMAQSAGKPDQPGEYPECPIDKVNIFSVLTWWYVGWVGGLARLGTHRTSFFRSGRLCSLVHDRVPVRMHGSAAFASMDIKWRIRYCARFGLDVH